MTGKVERKGKATNMSKRERKDESKVKEEIKSREGREVRGKVKGKIVAMKKGMKLNE